MVNGSRCFVGESTSQNRFEAGPGKYSIIQLQGVLTDGDPSVTAALALLLRAVGHGTAAR